MPNLSNYPFKSAKTIDGKTYISLEEVNEMLDNLQNMGPIFKQIADATSQMKKVFGDTKNKADNLLVELQKETKG